VVICGEDADASNMMIILREIVSISFIIVSSALLLKVPLIQRFRSEDLTTTRSSKNTFLFMRDGSTASGYFNVGDKVQVGADVWHSPRSKMISRNNVFVSVVFAWLL
jgi:hypothetical protein